MLGLCILLLQHGNNYPERDLSINKRLFEKHGSNMDQDTLEVLLVTKDYLIQVRQHLHAKINMRMFKSCKNSCLKFQVYLKQESKKKDKRR